MSTTNVDAHTPCRVRNGHADAARRLSALSRSRCGILPSYAASSLSSSSASSSSSLLSSLHADTNTMTVATTQRHRDCSSSCSCCCCCRCCSRCCGGGGARDGRRRPRRYVCPIVACFAGVIGAALPCLYRVHCAVGRGAYATVWLLVCNRTDTRVIGKLTRAARPRHARRVAEHNVEDNNDADDNGRRRVDDDAAAAAATSDAKREAVHQCACHAHPNVLRLLHTYERDGAVLHLLEYADAGDLYMQLMARRRRALTAATRTTTRAVAARTKAAADVSLRATTTTTSHDTHDNNNSRADTCRDAYFTEDEVLLLFTQLCMAVHHLHTQRILHHDLKASNVMLTRAGVVKLGDFGFARRYDSDVYASDVATLACGTPAYMAPELWRRCAYNGRAEVWALGVILSEMLSLSCAVLRTTQRATAAAHNKNNSNTNNDDAASLQQQQQQQRQTYSSSSNNNDRAHHDTATTHAPPPHATVRHTQRSATARADLMLLRLIALRKRCVTRVPAHRYSDALVTLLKGMLSMDAALRPTVADVLRCPLLQQRALPLLCAHVPRLRTLSPDVRRQLVDAATQHMQPSADE